MANNTVHNAPSVKQVMFEISLHSWLVQWTK